MKPTRSLAPIAIALLVALTIPAQAQEKEKESDKGKTEEKEKAAGPGPLDLYPKGYLGHAALGEALARVAAAHPDRVKVESLARSGQGREVWMATLSANGSHTSKARPRPAILIVANLEADHVVGSHVALGLIERLAAAKEPGWLDRVTLHIVPRLNPDGAERALGAPPVPIRTNLRPIDRDRDGRSGEDGPDDLNGDGVVTRMRLKDPRTATLVPEPGEPRLLRKADPAKGEQPVYAEEDEGRDDDGDGLRNEDAPGGVNLNRNWPQRWAEFDPEAGFSPASEPEVFALISFGFAHPEIVAAWSFGLNDNLREPSGGHLEGDGAVFADLSKAFNKAATPGAPPGGGSRAGKGSAAPGATTDGAFSEWAYHQFGAVGLASRLWTTPAIPAPADPKDKEKKPIPDGGEARWLYWNDHVAGGRAFVPFAAIDLPGLGRVEVGGWRPGVRLNPPASEVAPIADAHLAFLSALVERLPRLEVRDARAEAKGGRLFAVSATVVNPGGIPTALAQGVRTRKAPPVLVRLDAGKGRLLTGRPLERIESLAGSARREFRWLVLAPEGVDSVRLDVSCPKAGHAEATIALRSP